ncbi:MAG: protein kinase [Candidatus Obscuribacterales bacterium]|nr:protein kinase [Candidatus Obscuribacterales bacterium]
MYEQGDIPIGSHIGRYKVVEMLGTGAMGIVLKGIEPHSGEEVAIKLLASELVKDNVAIQRMAQEAQLLSHLKHPNIPETYNFGTLDNGRAYLVMEFVQGETLESYVERKGTAPLDMTVNVGLQLAHAMQAAHTEGIVHRDLKPPNVMLGKVDDKLAIKVLDFGVARILSDSRRLTKTGEAVGSPIFMSPEQCQGKPMDHRSDMYSYAIILFYCLTGRFPHKASNLHDTFVMKTTLECPQIKEFNPSHVGPPALDELIYKCMRISPDERYEDMGEVFRELKKVAEAAQIRTDSLAVLDLGYGALHSGAGTGSGARGAVGQAVDLQSNPDADMDTNWGADRGPDRASGAAAWSRGSEKLRRRAASGADLKEGFNWKSPQALVIGLCALLAMAFAVMALVSFNQPQVKTPAVQATSGDGKDGASGEAGPAGEADSGANSKSDTRSDSNSQSNNGRSPNRLGATPSSEQLKYKTIRDQLPSTGKPATGAAASPASTRSTTGTGTSASGASTATAPKPAPARHNSNKSARGSSIKEPFHNFLPAALPPVALPTASADPPAEAPTRTKSTTPGGAIVSSIRIENFKKIGFGRL